MQVGKIIPLPSNTIIVAGGGNEKKPMPSPIVLHVYSQETQEVEKTYSVNFIPWKILKKAIRLNKSLAGKKTEEYEESDLDEISSLVIAVCGNGLTVEQLDEGCDVTEMMSVIQAIVTRARGIMDPTLPSRT